MQRLRIKVKYPDAEREQVHAHLDRLMNEGYPPDQIASYIRGWLKPANLPVRKLPRKVPRKVRRIKRKA